MVQFLETKPAGGAAAGGGYATVQDEGTALIQRAILNLRSAIGQAGDDPANIRTDLYINGKLYEAIVDSVEAVVLDSGTTTAVGGQPPNTITDGLKAWTVNQWTAFRVVMTSGATIGQSRRVLSNTAGGQLTYAAPLVGVGIGDTFELIADTATFRRLRDALAFGARSIFFRTGVDAGTVVWAGADACTFLSGDSTTLADISFVLQCNKDDAVLQFLYFSSGAQLRIGHNAVTERVKVLNCLFQTGATPAIVFGGTVVSWSYDCLVFGCVFRNLTASAITTGPVVTNIGRHAFLGCTFLSCGGTTDTVDLQSVVQPCAVVSCTFFDCSPQGLNVGNINMGAVANQIATANKVASVGTGPGLAGFPAFFTGYCLKALGAGAQVVGNLAILGTLTSRGIWVGNNATVSGNVAVLVDAAKDEQVGIDAAGVCNIAGNYVDGISTKNQPVHLQCIRVGAGCVVSGNTMRPLIGVVGPNGLVTGVVTLGPNSIISANVFNSNATSTATEPVAIRLGANLASQVVIDGNCLQTAAGQLPTSTTGWKRGVVGATGLTKIGITNQGIWMEQHLRDDEEDFEGNALSERWAAFGAGGSTTFMPGRGSFVRLTAVGAGNVWGIELPVSNITENPVFGSSVVPEIIFRVRINHAGNLKVWIGLWDDGSTCGNADPTNFEGVKLVKALGVGNWLLAARAAAGALQTTDSGIAGAAGIIEDFVFRRCTPPAPDGALELFYRGYMVATLNAGIPAVNLRLGLKVANDGGDAELDADVIRWRMGV